MYFVCNGIVLVDETRDGVNVKLEKWQEALESRALNFKVSYTKTKYMDCNFNGDVQRPETTVRIEPQVIQ